MHIKASLRSELNSNGPDPGLIHHAQNLKQIIGYNRGRKQLTRMLESSLARSHRRSKKAKEHGHKSEGRQTDLGKEIQGLKRSNYHGQLGVRDCRNKRDILEMLEVQETTPETRQ